MMHSIYGYIHMTTQDRRLIIRQVDDKLSNWVQFGDVNVPPKGWIHAIRIAMGMSLSQLAKRLKKTVASTREIEEREQSQAITLKKLREAAEALDAHLVYALVPKGGSLEALIEKRAIEVARKIVMRTSHSMALEDQQNSQLRLEKAIQEKAEELRREAPKLLWN